MSRILPASVARPTPSAELAAPEPAVQRAQALFESMHGGSPIILYYLLSGDQTGFWRRPVSREAVRRGSRRFSSEFLADSAGADAEGSS